MLVEIQARDHLQVSLAYGTTDNFVHQMVYENPYAVLHREAHAKLEKAYELARGMGLGLKIFDAFRPQEAQEKLWSICPDPIFLADPAKGSPHSRGVAVDLTLIDESGTELDMGTAFDAFTEKSFHARTDVSVKAQRNRLLLLGLMTAAGWDFYDKEWWHYQLFNARDYALLHDKDAPRPMMRAA